MINPDGESIGMKQTFQYHSSSAAETERIGALLGIQLNRGDLVALDGDLGAGKTHFTFGIAKSLQISDYITSPTFTIVNEYHTGRVPLYHFDVYRLSSYEELMEIGFEEYAAGGGILVVEWASRIPVLLSEAAIIVSITRRDDLSPEERDIRIVCETGKLIAERMKSPC